MDPKLVVDAVSGFAEFLIKYLVALAAVGALTMALIEAAKKMFDLRTKYHLRAVKGWTLDDKQALHRIDLAHKLLGPTYFRQPSDVFSELLHLTTGSTLKNAQLTAEFPSGPMLAPFSLEIERMMGHIQDATDSALDNPMRYPSLYFFATSGAEEEDVLNWAKTAQALPTGVTIERGEAKQRADLYARLHGLAKRKLDAFQLQTSYKWANWNQFLAIVLGAVILFTTLLWINKGVPSGVNLLLFVSASLVGGILSPIAKDLITLLRKVKQGV